MTSTITCLVTIHGIGFQQPPQPDMGIPGYADLLHKSMTNYLDETMLDDDPYRERQRRGENGPIYVESKRLPVAINNRKMGLDCFGTWSRRDIRKIDALHTPLGNGNSRIIHIALV